MQWQNPNGSTTNGVVIEDGAGNKLGTAANPLNVTGGGGGGGGSNASVGAAGASVPASATAIGFQNASGNLSVPTSVAGLPVADSGVAITGVSLPAGGVGVTGWLSAIWSRVGGLATAANQPSLVATSSGAAERAVVSDPASGVGALVTAFHDADNQAISGTSYGMMTGGVAQLVNPAGNLDRQRETGFDGVPSAGVAAGAQQLAGPPAVTTVTSGAITANAVAQTVTLNALSFTNRGVTTTIQAGSGLLVDTGASQESVYVSAVNTATKQITAIFARNHAANVGVVTFAYNQARDATIPDGSTPAGIAASAEYFYNASTSTVEAARSAAGELDGATGTGTPIAAEYEWNGGGPVNGAGIVTGFSFDRSRNLQGKGAGGSTLNGAISAGAASIAINAVAGLQPGQQIRLDRGLGTEEAAYVSQNYVAGSLTVALQSTLAQAHSSGGTVDWDVFASAGPGLNGFMPAGIGIEEEALYDPVSGKYYIERAATQDGCPPQNVVLENVGLYNGATIDRLRGGRQTGSALVQQVDSSAGLSGGSADIGGSGNFSFATTLSGFPLATAGYQSMLLECAAGFTGTLYFYGSNDNWTTQYPILASRLDVTTVAPAGSVSNPAAGALWDIPLKFAQFKIAASATNAGAFQWCLKAGGVARAAVDQGAANASSAWLVQAKAVTSGGISSMAPIISTASSISATNIKSSLGQVYAIDISNTTATIFYLKLFNGSGAPAPGTTPAVAVYAIQPNSSRFISFADLGAPFSSGIGWAITGAPALNDTTTVSAAGAGVGTIHYV